MRRLSLIVPALALLTAASAPAMQRSTSADCARTSVGLTALPDLKGGEYGGFQGGLYPEGRNSPTSSYLKRGLAAAKLVKPRGPDGKPKRGGAIVLLSIGMSNTTQEFSAFQALAQADPRRNPSVVVVDGAQGGQDAEQIKEPAARFWGVVEQRLAAAGVTRRQVQAVWLKQAIARPTEPFPADARRLQRGLRAIVAILRSRNPQLRLVYLSSRTYAGYAVTPLNPEPYAYHSGFAVKWTVQEAIAGPSKGRPWLAWGPYLWTDGTRGRGDGFTWTCDDVRSDGTHPSPAGRQKVAGRLLRFFTTSRTAKSWFVR